MRQCHRLGPALRVDVARRGIRRACRPEQELTSLGRTSRDGDRLAQVGDGLVMSAERRGPLGGAGQGQPGLDGDRVGLGALGRGLVGGDVVRGQRAGQLVLAERLEVAGRGEVAGRRSRFARVP
jgi:hypothetical protein